MSVHGPRDLDLTRVLREWRKWQTQSELGLGGQGLSAGETIAPRSSACLLQLKRDVGLSPTTEQGGSESLQINEEVGSWYTAASRTQLMLVEMVSGGAVFGGKYLGEGSYDGHFLHSLSISTLGPEEGFAIPSWVWGSGVLDMACLCQQHTSTQNFIDWALSAPCNQ